MKNYILKIEAQTSALKSRKIWGFYFSKSNRHDAASLKDSKCSARNCKYKHWLITTEYSYLQKGWCDKNETKALFQSALI